MEGQDVEGEDWQLKAKKWHFNLKEQTVSRYEERDNSTEAIMVMRR